MITFNDAKAIALKEIARDSDLIPNEVATLEKPFGWYFQYATKSGEILFGCNGFIVDRDDGHVFQFGSAYSLERDFAAYEAGFRFHSYDLTIVSISNLEKTAQLLFELRMTYVIPEEESGIVWIIPKTYEKEQILSAFQSLPCTFSNQGFILCMKNF